MNQIELHKKIDNLISDGTRSATSSSVKNLIDTNDDSRRYFYNKADESWFGWLWDNGFFDILKKKAKDPTKYSYQIVELNYVVRIAEKIPTRVVDFILSVPISAATFNPEVVDRFLWIASKLPAGELRRVVPKMRADGWVPLMGRFNRWAFEFKNMFDTLAGADDHESIVRLAEVILTLRTKQEIEEAGRGWGESPFYFHDIHHSEVFAHLSKVDDKNVESAFAIATKTLGAIAQFGPEKEDTVFKYGDLFSLYDVDFFELQPGMERHLSARDDVRDLAAVVKLFAVKLVSGSCENSAEVRRIYSQYIVSLPDARTMWRFRLFIWSLCPAVFEQELKNAFNLVFKHPKEPYPIVGGAEYEQAIKAHFGIFTEPEQRAYVKGIFALLGTDKTASFWYGVLSSISKHLTPEERQFADKVMPIALKDDFKPEPSIGMTYAGTVVPQSPEDSDSEWGKSISEIINLLKTKWAPAALANVDKKQDYLRPVNAEGVADRMRIDMKVRLADYIASAQQFFDHDALDPHYTYSFLRGINEIIRLDIRKVDEIDLGKIVALGKDIVAFGQKQPFDVTQREGERFNAWLAGWKAVHSTLADVLEEFLRDNTERTTKQFANHRNDLLEIISYLFSFPDPQPADEEVDESKIKKLPSGEDEYQMSDPFTTAINTTRGRAFQAFLQFVYHEGKNLPKESPSKLSGDVMALYESVLARENTRAIMFMFGHYLAFFYYRNTKWGDTILPKLFLNDASRGDLFLAAWEGYLTAALYEELFEKLHDQYAQAIVSDPGAYTKRKYRGNLDEALATHLALAYVHFDDFGFQSDLYESFWKNKNTKRQGTFISFIGRHVISRDQASQWIAEKKVNVKKLSDFWEWALLHCADKEALKEFGFWMQTKHKIFNPVWLAEHIDKTLEKTGGDVDWELGMVDSLPDLAKAAPEKTLSILRRYLLDGSTLRERPGYLRMDQDLRVVLRDLYANSTTKEATYQLINDLLPIGNGQFWDLKDIVK